MASYLCFTLDHDKDAAVKTFQERFGREPGSIEEMILSQNFKGSPFGVLALGLEKKAEETEMNDKNQET